MSFKKIVLYEILQDFFKRNHYTNQKRKTINKMKLILNFMFKF